MAETPVAAREPVPPFYLPDLCAPRAVLGIVLTTELIAVLLATARVSITGRFWDDVARTSLFLLWITLCSAGALCVLRPLLARLGVAWGSAAALARGLASALRWSAQECAERGSRARASIVERHGEDAAANAHLESLRELIEVAC